MCLCGWVGGGVRVLEVKPNESHPDSGPNTPVPEVRLPQMLHVC